MKFSEIIQEARNPEWEYEDFENKVILRLEGYDSQFVTKLAKSFQDVAEAKEKLAALEEIHKQQIRDLHELFDAADALKTREIETKSLVVQISKDPAPTKTPKYKEILTQIMTHMNPELLAMTKSLIETIVTVVQKPAGVKVKPLDESTMNALLAFAHQVKAKVLNWANSYDQKLLMLKNAIARA
jgi:septal ring factor EnvC (AmiA/AmiB activator)